MKAARNKTIDMSIEDGKLYLDRCISINEPVEIGKILNRTILGDCLEVIPLLPKSFIDLLIVDPPYNLDKNFHGRKFKKASDDAYEEYTETWVKAILSHLNKDATIYVCCDWASSLSIGRVLKKYFTIQNRITWQREKGRGALTNWKNGMEDIWFATNSQNYTLKMSNLVDTFLTRQ